MARGRVSRADRIRSMSDEEMALLVVQSSTQEHCRWEPRCMEQLKRNGDAKIPESWCVECALKWLREENE